LVDLFRDLDDLLRPLSGKLNRGELKPGLLSLFIGQDKHIETLLDSLRAVAAIKVKDGLFLDTFLGVREEIQPLVAYYSSISR